MTWHKALDLDELPEGRVTTVTIGTRSLALAHHEGVFGALDNHCPHQGGPLGEGTIEPGKDGGFWLRCPWHGYDYSPVDGKPPAGFSDAPPCFSTEVREDGVYVDLPAEAAPARSVSDVMVETMVNWGVTHVFGMVGHSNLGFADAMRTAEERGDLTFIGIRHEGAAAFAATAYGKLTGGLAGCFGIAGPGSTNLLTGLYDAKQDRAPVLALSGQVPSKVKGRGAFQDMDLEGAFADVARFSESVQAGSLHAELMTLACKTAIIESDVAHLVFPDEVQVQASDADAGGPTGRVGSRLIRPPEEELATAAQMLSSAARPLFVVGNGARHQMGPVIALAEQLGVPVVTTFKGKGLIPDSHPLGCGVLGRSGTPIASWMMNESDLILAWGVSFANHTGIADYKPTIQIDRDPMALGRFHSVDVPVQGDVGITAAMLGSEIGSEVACTDHTEEIAERWAIWREEKGSRRQDDQGNGLNAALLFHALTEAVPANAAMCVDVGNNTYSFGRYFEPCGQDVLMSGYLGSIGFALPAAMGAWAAVSASVEPSRKVVSISGDGGLGQYAMELTTLAKYGMDVTHVVMNNGQLGKISKEQRAAEFDVWQTSLHNPDFAAFAELCGVKGFRVTEPAELDAALAEAISHPGPALVEVVTDALLV